MTTQPKALRLANYLESKYDLFPRSEQMQAVSELRRLHEENQRCKQVCAATAEWWRVERDALLGVLKNIERSTYDAGTAALARVAIAKVEGRMIRDVCEHHTPVDLPCDKCHADKLTVAYTMGAQSRLRTLTDEVIAELWYKNGTHHHHFARAIERWLKGEQ